ncbi:DUF4190 domain-containing protein [Arthrobacter sp. E918]|uniref:DUF4190 domain-containing protein n=2 Tax=Arthrobacter mobilis TaxID=2724944 RepID=A0A7X6HDP9_9MICC|nr:DUF4190 domain-containing protein [Arthrobacter mobilis]
MTDGGQDMAGQEHDNTPPFNDPTHPAWYTDPSAKQPERPLPPPGPGAAPGPYGYQPGYGMQQPPGYGTYGTPGYGQPGYGLGQPAARGLSVAALVCGLVSMVTIGLFFIPQILAIVFGHLALRREPAGRTMALAGLIMGYIVAAIWAVLLFFVAVGAVFAP